MIVSREHGFLFVKTRKTAGTSIEIALSPLCGPRDVITPISPEDEAVRRSNGGPGPQHYWVPWYRYRPADVVGLFRGKGRRMFYNHMPAEKAKAELGEEWPKLYRFAVDRNPWDRMVSQYFWSTKDRPERPPFGQWLRSVGPRVLSNYYLYSIDGKVAVDRVLHYERLDDELGEVLAHLGLERAQLPRTKADVRTDRRPYQELYGDEERDLVARGCQREIALLGYEF